MSFIFNGLQDANMYVELPVTGITDNLQSVILSQRHSC